MLPHDFHPIDRRWWETRFSTGSSEPPRSLPPTDAQAEGWRAIRRGEHTLIAAPTGSGKTLAAFLTSLDQLLREGLDASRDGGALPDEVRVIYVSPLKALSADIHKNLAEPRREMRRIAGEMGYPPLRLTAAVRSGDTPQKERAAMLKTPPHILLTTPESLYLLAKIAGLKRSLAHTGAVTLIQRFGSAANLNIHLHCLVLDGVYRTDSAGVPVFHEVRAPTREELQALLSKIVLRILKLLTRRGALVEEQGMTYLAEVKPSNALTALAKRHRAATAWHWGRARGRGCCICKQSPAESVNRPKPCAPTRMPLACTRGCAAAPISVSNWNVCADTSPARRSHTGASNATAPARWCCNSRARIKTAPPTSSCRRWNSCSGSPRSCPARACT